MQLGDLLHICLVTIPVTPDRAEKIKEDDSKRSKRTRQFEHEEGEIKENDQIGSWGQKRKHQCSATNATKTQFEQFNDATDRFEQFNDATD